jgi:hypothetical protein
VKNRYKIPWHVRQYVKKELMDYKANKKLIAKYTGDTRGLILANVRLAQIDNVLNSLNKEDREAAELIFIDKYTQSGAEIAKGLSKAAYYNAMNKVIYLTAIEMELI